MEDDFQWSIWGSVSSTKEEIPFELPLDFDTFVDWTCSQAATAAVDVQLQTQQVLAELPTVKIRPANGTITETRIKRQRIEHRHTCDLHQPPKNRPSARCFGKSSLTGPYKGARCKRTVTTYVDGQAPVCGHHRTQVMKIVGCEAILDCGSPCNEIVPWSPHGYRLCESHRERGRCHFMELYVEIRLMIYQYLIPDKPVPAHGPWKLRLRENSKPVSTALFRVNKTIHEEVADLFYGQSTFDIEITNDWNRNSGPNIFMCRSKEKKDLAGEFYMQFLEPLSIQWAREAGNRSPYLHPNLRNLLATGFTAWQPPLSSRYFERIRSFRMTIIFNTPPKNSPLGIHYMSQSAETKAIETNRHFLCDYLHQFVDRLVANDQLPLRKFELRIRVGTSSFDKDDARANTIAMGHCRALMQPLRRLRSRITNPVSLERSPCFGKDEIDLLSVRLWENDRMRNNIQRFLHCFRTELTDFDSPAITATTIATTAAASRTPPRSPILKRYAELAKIVSEMSQYPYWRDCDLEEMVNLLNEGRKARESNDMKDLTAVFRDLFKMLMKYNSEHLEFLTRVRKSFEVLRS